MEAETAGNRQEHAVPKAVFLAEVNYWAAKIGVEPTEVRVRRLVNKWGSRSADGRVSFNSELLWRAPSFRKRTIVEQLLRLKIPDDEEALESLLRQHVGYSPS